MTYWESYDQTISMLFFRFSLANQSILMAITAFAVKSQPVLYLSQKKKNSISVHVFFCTDMPLYVCFTDSSPLDTFELELSYTRFYSFLIFHDHIHLVWVCLIWNHLFFFSETTSLKLLNWFQNLDYTSKGLCSPASVLNHKSLYFFCATFLLTIVHPIQAHLF